MKFSVMKHKNEKHSTKVFVYPKKCLKPNNPEGDE